MSMFHFQIRKPVVGVSYVPRVVEQLVQRMKISCVVSDSADCEVLACEQWLQSAQRRVSDVG